MDKPQLSVPPIDPNDDEKGLLYKAINWATKPKYNHTISYVPKYCLSKLRFHRLTQAISTGVICGSLLLFTGRAGAEERTQATTNSALSSFLDHVSARAFTTGYYLLNSHVKLGAYNTQGYPYVKNQGFGITFLGVDTSYQDDKFGITLDFRFGPQASVLTFYAPVKQAFVTLKPSDSFTLDFGYFDTIFGVEIGDEWLNPTFSRGVLYFFRQPFYHTGIRASMELNDHVGLKFLVANGLTSIDDLGWDLSETFFEDVPSVGAQLSLSSGPMSLGLGYMVGPNGADENRSYGHFFDIANVYDFGATVVLLNIDVTVDPDPAPSTLDPNLSREDLAVKYGAALSVSHALSDKVSLGARGEFLGSNDSASAEDYLVTLTGTLRYSPVKQVYLSLEPRAEFSDVAFFPTSVDGDGAPKKWFFGGMVGVTAVIGG